MTGFFFSKNFLKNQKKCHFSLTFHVNNYMKLKRNDETRVEKCVGEWLDDHFYNNTEIFDETERVHDLARQVAGIDVIAKRNDKVLNIDEKVKYYKALNTTIDAIGFELLRTTRDGKRTPGWFVDKQSLTTHYSLLSLYLKDRSEDPKAIAYDNIDYIVNLLVNAREIKEVFANYLSTLPFSYKELLDIVTNGPKEYFEFPDGMSYKSDDYKARLFLTKDMWITYSKTFKEQPINLVVTRNLLKSLSKTEEHTIK